MSHSTRRIPIVLASLPLLLFTLEAFAADPRISATSRAEPSHELTSAERRATSLAAGRILRHAYLARQAVAEEDGKKAGTEVDQAKQLVRIIESVQPKCTVTRT